MRQFIPNISVVRELQTFDQHHPTGVASVQVKRRDAIQEMIQLRKSSELRRRFFFVFAIFHHKEQVEIS